MGYGKPRILVVEDKDSMAKMLREALEGEGYEVSSAPGGQEGEELLKAERFDLVLTDMKLPGKDGLEMLRLSKDLSPLTPVIIMTAFGTIETAVTAMKEGAFDFITKPFDVDHLLVLISRALENRKLFTENLLLKDEFTKKRGIPTIIGQSAKIAEVARNIQKVSQAKTTVLLMGESGTGKELFARAIHHLSPRKDFPFVPINCAAIPRDLLESELFGFEKGAFTGAEARKLGKFELAHNGTIFLDEIGEMDPALQAKILRAIQDGEIERVGSAKSVKTDVRIIAASNRDLAKAVNEGNFREDLYYRLSVFPITVPPLRERREDIPLLVEYFIRKCASDLKRDAMAITPEALSILAGSQWKGNVRELENTIERAIILCDDGTILPEHVMICPLGGGQTSAASASFTTLEEGSKSASREVETRMIRESLARFGGNKTRVAEALKVSYKTLLTKIKEYKIE